MKAKLWIPFIAVLFLPFFALFWVGLNWTRNERQLLENRFQDWRLMHLTTIRNGVDRYFEDRAKELSAFLEDLPQDKNALRDRVRSEGRIHQVFRLDARGLPLHPSPKWDDLSRAERRFLQRTERLFSGKALLDAGFPGPLPEETLRDKRFFKGWYAYYWESGIHLLYALRHEDGSVTGCELERMRWIADLVGTIARSGDGSNIPFQCVLLDSSDRIQWVRGDLPRRGDKPLDTLDLAWPLSSWKLACFDAGTTSPALGRSLFFNFVSGISVLFLALSALFWIFYREHTRQMREASNRVNFVNQVSHELKTPLTAIRMYAELLENRIDGETDPKAREHLDVIVRESRRLSRLITNILTFGRKQRNGIVLRKHPGNPGEVVKKTVEQFRPSLEEEGIEVVLDFEDGFFESEMELDADALQQILGNLINNVEKYAAKGKWIKIRCFREGGFQVITVSDRGPGIPKSKRKKIFEPFYRISNRLTDGVSGTGIGLDIARELARLHGGDLVLIHSDRGSCFRVSIR